VPHRNFHRFRLSNVQCGTSFSVSHPSPTIQIQYAFGGTFQSRLDGGWRPVCPRDRATVGVASFTLSVVLVLFARELDADGGGDLDCAWVRSVRMINVSQACIKV